MLPRASGSASLGAEQVDGRGGLTTDIRPYAHVHQNSGVFHGRLGQSGVLRYTQNTPDIHNNLPVFECSTDGGLTFGVLPHSGQIQESINEFGGAGGGGADSLQASYDGGNEIDLDHDILRGAAASAGMEIGVEPVIIKHATPGAGHINGVHGRAEALEDACVVASGFTLTPNSFDTFAFTAIGPNYFMMQASGTAAESPTNFHIGLPNADSLIGGLANFSTNASMLFTGRALTFSNEDGDGDITLNAEVSPGLGVGGQVDLRAFAASGRMEYRFGPHQSWYMKRTHSSTSGPLGDGFEPLVPSGGILQMIAENATGGASTLQEAYDNGQRIDISTLNLPVHISSTGSPATNSYLLFLQAAENDHPHILMSGIIGAPDTGQTTPGALWLQRGTAGVEVQRRGLTMPNSYEAVQARSYGPDMMFYHAGSGLVTLRPASGVAYFYNNAITSSITEDRVNIPFNVKNNPEDFYAVNASSGVTVMVNGFYKIHGTATVLKTQGNLRQSFAIDLRATDRFGNEDVLNGSSAAGSVRDSDNHSFASVNTQWAGDLYAGETLNMTIVSLGIPPADNSFRTSLQTSNILIEYIGPLAGGR